MCLGSLHHTRGSRRACVQPPSLCADAATPTCPFPPALQSNNALPTVPPTQLSAPAPHAGPPTRCCRRPRERIHRPQTRRRRENNIDSLDKLRMIRENVLKALDIFECLVKRERKKRDLVVSRELAWCGVRWACGRAGVLGRGWERGREAGREGGRAQLHASVGACSSGSARRETCWW